MRAVPARAGPERLLLHAHRVLALDHLDRRVHDVRHVHAHGGDAVLGRGRALAAPVHLVEHRPAAVGPPRAEDEQPGRAGAARRSPDRAGPARAPCMIASTTRCDVSWLPPTTGRSGSQLQHAAARHDDLERPVAALVGRHVGGGQRLHRVVHRRARDEVRGVDGPADLAVAAAEVERGLDRRACRCGRGCGCGRSSTPSSSSQSSPSHTPSGSARSAARIPRLGLGVEALEAALDRLGAVALEQLGEPARRDVVRRVLGEEIALALLAAAQVRQDRGRCFSRSGPAAVKIRIGAMRRPSW